MPFLFFNSQQGPATKWYTVVACACAFCLFSFCYLLFYQTDVLVAGQHVLSEGKTHYVGWVGAVLITLTLFLLQRVVFMFTKLSKRAHFLTYFPSMLILTIVTDVSSNIDLGFSFGGWYVAVPILMLFFIGAVWTARQMEPFEPEPASPGVTSRTIWVNLIAMVVMMVLTGIFSNGDEAFHQRMRMERLIAQGKYAQAIKVGRKSQVADPQITMLRAFALSKKGLMGEHFFEYPFVREGKTLMHDTIGNRTILLNDSILATVVKSSRARLDYKLIDMLIDRDVEKFAVTVRKAYPDSIMPKHYAEALAIYKKIAPPPPPKAEETDSKKGKKKKKKKEEEKVVVQAPDPMQLRLDEFLKMKEKKDKPGWALQLRKKFGDTYWYYYYMKDE
ncbi:MAG: hypothetical protein IKH88_11650 [Prevotella sp.]|nr:hypothetical protein [Prevotella sp.]